MHRRNTYTHSINEKPGSQFNSSWTVHKSCRIIIYAILMVMYLGSSLVIVPDIANAEEVYGNIECDNCSSRILLIFKKGDRVIEKVRADDKQYRVYLSEGSYNVEIISNGRRWSDTEESLTIKNHQDISIESERIVVDINQ